MWWRCTKRRPSRTLLRARTRWRSPQAWCCSPRHARASTCSATTRSADGSSRTKSRGLREEDTTINAEAAEAASFDRLRMSAHGELVEPCDLCVFCVARRDVSGEQSSVGVAVGDWLLGT